MKLKSRAKGIWLRLKCLVFLVFIYRIRDKEKFLIYCDPRGGSTWLAELLSKQLSSIVIWEPFSNNNMKKLKKSGVSIYQEKPSEDQEKQLSKHIKNLFKDLKINVYNAYLISIRDFFVCKTVLFKLCRANVIFPLILGCAEIEAKPVHLIRNVFAVVNSQMRSDYWKNFCLNKKKYSLNTEQFNFMNELTTLEEKLCFHWCVHNKNMLRIGEENVLRIFYENLVLDTESELKKIMGTWGKEFQVFESYSKPSKTSFGEFNKDPEVQLYKWQKQLTIEQIDNIQRVLDFFNITIYSKESVMPNS